MPLFQQIRKLIAKSVSVMLLPLCILLLPSTVRSQTSADGVDPQLLSYLESRVTSRPEDAASWRLLGRAYQENGQTDQAFQALRRSIELSPESAAAYFDMAEVMRELDRPDQVQAALLRVLSLAPESVYAQQAREQLSEASGESGGSGVVQVGYEINRFEGPELIRPPVEEVFRETVDDAWPPVVASIEIGALYNTNVALTPSSRDFATVRSASAQLVASPKIEYWLFEGETWRAGPVFSGDFTLNEQDYKTLNLQSYRPGAFVEQSIFLDGVVVIPRLQYIYSLDQFDGHTFDDRHALTASTTALWDGGDSTVGYLTTNLTDFANDGDTPALTSRDGWTYGLGVSHTHAIRAPYLTAVSFGTDLEIADVDGSTFAYNGISTSLAGEFPLWDRLSLIVDGSWGYRDYHRATVTPSRNQNIWHGGGRLLFRVNAYYSVAGVFKYDKFDSRNPIFQSDRILCGIVTSFTF